MRLLVTGCAGSGTGFIACVLFRCGVRCGHEQVFRNDGSIEWADFDAESSWLAADRLAGIEREPEIARVHLVRHPVRVARSIVRFFDTADVEIGDHLPEWKTQRDVVRKFLPEVFEARTPIERFCRYWQLWNTEIEKYVPWRVRIEDLVPENLVEFCRVVGKPCSREQAATALWSMPTNTNTHWYRDPRIQPSDVRSLAELADRYGYKLDEG